jgi:hypothetical protein
MRPTGLAYYRDLERKCWGELRNAARPVGSSEIIKHPDTNVKEPRERTILDFESLLSRVQDNFLTQRRKGKGQETQSRKHVEAVSKTVLNRRLNAFSNPFLFPFAGFVSFLCAFALKIFGFSNPLKCYDFGNRPRLPGERVFLPVKL